MDNIGFLLLSRSQSETLYKDLFLLIIVIPILKYYLTDISYILKRINNFIFTDYKNRIEFVGWENLYNGFFCYDYPLPMTAICHTLSEKNICTDLRYFTPSRNGNSFTEEIYSFRSDKNISYMLNYGENIKIEDDLYLDFSYYKMETSKDSRSDGNWKVNVTLKSKNKTINEMNKFINACIVNYDKYMDEKNRNKIYHFIYQGKDHQKKLNFSSAVLSDSSSPETTCYETFDNIYSQHKEMLMNDLKRLKDIEYYKKTGNKRKKGYLFYGPPGCGKTSSVVAMALHDKRHIIEISMSRIKTNEELEKIFNITEINGIKFSRDQIILLFDEIDTGNKVLKKRVGEDDAESISSSSIDDEETKANDKRKDEIIYKLVNKANSDDDYINIGDSDGIHIGCVLSRMDGVGCYNGLIVVATTNCKDKLSPALYRNGRLNPVHFDYVNKQYVKEMIEDYFDIQLTCEQIDVLPDYDSKISYSSIRKYIEDYENNLDGLIAFFKKS